MAQERYFEFQADDATKALNEWFLGINNAGVYRGFDAIESRADLQVKLLHTTTKFTYKAIDYGIVITQEGVIVKENATVDIATINPTTQKRIDLLILTHTYQPATAGGEDALYSVIQGTEHPTTPVAPYLSVPPNAVVLGELSLPASCTALNQVGVTFKRTQTPFYADFNTTKNVANIAERDALVVWEGRRCFVIDASADIEIGSGSAEYVWIGTPLNIWKRIAKDELSRKADKNQGAFTSIAPNSGWTGNMFARVNQGGFIDVRYSSVVAGSGASAVVYNLASPFTSNKVLRIPIVYTSGGGSATNESALLIVDSSGVTIAKMGTGVVNSGDTFYIPNFTYYN